jgi:hypothetical protein
MAHVNSTTHFVGATTGFVSEGHVGEGSTERIESAQLNDVVSHSGAVDDMSKAPALIAITSDP